ncbi:MAG TPA: GNAT family N-acetyltransferase [Candidatus Limnocylindrales bacterium]|jgi:mycothiol synthase
MTDASAGQAVSIRRLTSADMPALQPVVARAAAAGEFLGSSDPQATFFFKSFEFAPSPIAVATTASADGERLVGFVSPEFKVVVVEPDRRRQGIGRRLMDAAVAIELERQRPEVLMGVLPDDRVGKAFLAATGFAYHSTLWDLELPEGRPVAPPRWPAGVIARPFEQDRDARPWIELFNEAFATHATALQIPIEAADGPPDPAILDADTELVEDEATGQLIGFCATQPEREDGIVGPHAEIWTIGVRPDRQGRGLGRELLRWGVERLRGLGVRNVTLSVNSRNEHALALYEREGFERTAIRERWSRAVAIRDTASQP